MKHGASALLELRARLLDRLGALRIAGVGTAVDRRAVTLDQTSVGRLSRMDAMQVQAMALATEQKRGVEIRRIEAAIRRIDEGEYGFCLTCGEEIAAKRLAVDPATATCVRCASRQSR